MDLVKVPTADGDVHDDWKVIAQLAKFLNALGDLKIVPSETRNKLTWTESSATLELDLPDAAAATQTPWQANPSTWTGAGADPYASTRALRFLLNPSTVNGQTPSNMNTEFVAYGDITDTGITFDEAVITFVYWQAAISESAPGQGDFSMTQPVIQTVEGTQASNLTALVSPPDFGDDGSLPGYIIQQICVVQNYGGALHFPPGLKAYVTALPVVTGALNGVVGRQIQYTT